MRFSTSEIRWPQWLFSQIDLAAGMCLADVGSGPGNLWSEAASFLPPKLTVHLGDLSLGMITKARNTLVSDQRFSCLELDAQALPYSSNSLDALTAFHMLYHIPDIPQAVSEFRRVIKPGGRLYAVTNGENHMRELYTLIHQFTNLEELHRNLAEPRRFSLENAIEILKEHFDHVEVRRQENNLRVNEVAPLRNYIFSMVPGSIKNNWISAGELDERLREVMDKQGGSIFITKAAGVAIAY